MPGLQTRALGVDAVLVALRVRERLVGRQAKTALE